MALTRAKVFDEFVIDLVQIRKSKRLMNRAIKELEKIEKHILKFQKAGKPKPNADELAAVRELYGMPQKAERD